MLKSVKALTRTLLDILHTRLEILSLDVREMRFRLVSIMMLGACAFLFMTLGLILGSLWLILIFWETDRILVMGILTGALVLGAAIFLAILAWKLKMDPAVFHGSIEELDKDREALGGHRGRLE